MIFFLLYRKLTVIFINYFFKFLINMAFRSVKITGFINEAINFERISKAGGGTYWPREERFCSGGKVPPSTRSAETKASGVSHKTSTYYIF